MAVIVALGCSRLDVIGRIGDALGLVGAVDDLRRADGVTVSEDRVLVDARVADVPVLDHDVLQRAGRVAAEQLAVDDDLEEVGRLAVVAGAQLKVPR